MKGLRWTNGEYAQWIARHNRAAVSPTNMEPDSKPAVKKANASKAVYPRVSIRVHSKRRRLTDPDGIAAKAAIDGLVRGGLLTDDSAKTIKEVSFSQELSDVEETVIEVWEEK